VKLPDQAERDYAGLRNSHDKTVTAGLAAGTSVFTYDNLAFSGEVKIIRNYTRFAYRDLRNLTARAVGRGKVDAPWRPQFPHRPCHNTLIWHDLTTCLPSATTPGSHAPYPGLSG
jgi:hypothetical protein